MCFWKHTFKSNRNKATNLKWLENELRSISEDRNYNAEFKQYDCSAMYSTPLEIEENNEIYIFALKKT